MTVRRQPPVPVPLSRTRPSFSQAAMPATISVSRKSSRRRSFARVTHLLERYPTGFIFAFQFIYGLRMISPLAIGMFDVSAIKFVMINAASALIWGSFFSAISIEQTFGRLPFHRPVLIVAGIIAALLHVMMTFRKRRPA
ncbi:hypothetical protein PY650_32505 [Rhizobium calliandrae]|uniref:Uncharacterized protein n=1 Tax=Rhizobium calliandrae TaxID=1312182 RepID=A0ABT7KP86_9HYPH|nr:hypothetical protein [Rhizobium calliandrae]MDL2410246.1 hypothetical protein [Rhizobium calliandrae]